MQSNTLKISAIIVTYNWPEALEMILKSILQQKVLPGEVVIADDGSGPETALLLKRYQENFPVPMKHVWHEDSGFRGSAIRNRAIRASTGNYLVFSDGDLLFHPLFFHDFAQRAEKNQASVGSRVFLTPEASVRILEEKNVPGQVSFFSGKIDRNRLNALRVPILSRIMPPVTFTPRLRGGLLGVWKQDLESVNGWNESFNGWGLEDTELVARLYHAGITLRKLKSAGITWHLSHPESSRGLLEHNRRLLQETIRGELSWCENGLTSQRGS